MERLHEATRTALSDGPLRQRLTQQGVMVEVAGPAELAGFIEFVLAKWGDAVRLSGARAD